MNFVTFVCMTWCAIFYILELIRIYRRNYFAFHCKNVLPRNSSIVLPLFQYHWYETDSRLLLNSIMKSMKSLWGFHKKAYLKVIYKFEGRSLIHCFAVPYLSTETLFWSRWKLSATKCHESCSRAICFASEVAVTQMRRLEGYVRLVLNLSCFQSISIAFEHFHDSILLHSFFQGWNPPFLREPSSFWVPLSFWCKFKKLPPSFWEPSKL